jgi:hypothetical protein
VHAVALAAHSGARLVSVHACAVGAPPVELPRASVLLSRWGFSEDRAPHERLQHSCCDAVDDPCSTLSPSSLPICWSRVRTRVAVSRESCSAASLVDDTQRFAVVNLPPREALSELVAEGVALNLHSPTLLSPLGGPQLVDASSGTLAAAC